MDPYVYCITQGIIFNESIPLGITVTTTESSESFGLFFEHCDSQKKLEWQTKAVLSDMGLALISFCQNHNLIQFFCHRHMIEHFGF